MIEFFANPDLYIYIGLLLIILELIVGVDTGLDLFFVGLNFIISSFLQRLIDYPYTGLVSIFILSFLYVIFGRELIKQKVAVATHKTNVDSLIGRTGSIVKLNADKKSGLILVGSEKWRFESDQKVSEKESVIIDAVEGVTLKISKK